MVRVMENEDYDSENSKENFEETLRNNYARNKNRNNYGLSSVKKNNKANNRNGINSNNGGLKKRLNNIIRNKANVGE